MERPPAVPLSAPPPDGSPASGADIRRDERRVFRVVPLPRQLRVDRRQIVEAGLHPSPRAVGTARAAGSCVEHRPPGVAVCAAPPGGPFAAVCSSLRRERRIASVVPLVQQILLLVQPAILVQAPSCLCAHLARLPSCLSVCSCSRQIRMQFPTCLWPMPPLAPRRAWALPRQCCTKETFLMLWPG